MKKRGFEISSRLLFHFPKISSLSIQQATNERTNETTWQQIVTSENVNPISRCQQSSNQRGRNVASIRSIVRGPPCNSTRLLFEPEPLAHAPSLSIFDFLSRYLSPSFEYPIVASSSNQRTVSRTLIHKQMNNEFHRWIWFRLICTCCFQRIYSHKCSSWIFKIAIK